MKSSPLQTVRERFETKEALAEELAGALERREDESKEELKSRLLKTPNRKLLKLHAQTTDIDTRFGGRDALLDAVCSLKFGERKVEEAWRSKASNWSNGRLLDLHSGLQKRASA